MERVLFITGMGCEKCEAKVRAALEAVPGVSKAVVSYDGAELTNPGAASKKQCNGREH